MRITPHFSLQEMTVSQTATRKGIDNQPSADVIKNLEITCNGLEEIRGIIKCPILVSSGYRCFELNEAVGGAPDSDHIKGLAADIYAPRFGTAFALATVIKDNMQGLPVDLLILEFNNWVHVSFGQPRRKLVLSRVYGSPDYLPGLVAA